MNVGASPPRTFEICELREKPRPRIPDTCCEESVRFVLLMRPGKGILSSMSDDYWGAQGRAREEEQVEGRTKRQI
jgi:hypothetical protein